MVKFKHAQTKFKHAQTKFKHYIFYTKTGFNRIFKIIDVQNLLPISFGTALVCITRYQMVEICV